ncbi:MAG: hypothetical protein GY835_23635 [bacterium]|nr:hypothetical protein [bacterium]
MSESLNPNELEIRERQLRELGEISDSLRSIERSMEVLVEKLPEQLREICDRISNLEGLAGR